MFISDKRKPVEEVSMVWSPSKCLLKSTYVYLDVEEPEDIVVVRREVLSGERITVTSLTVDGKPTKGTDEHFEFYIENGTIKIIHGVFSGLLYYPKVSHEDSIINHVVRMILVGRTMRIKRIKAKRRMSDLNNRFWKFWFILSGLFVTYFLFIALLNLYWAL